MIIKRIFFPAFLLMASLPAVAPGVACAQRDDSLTGQRVFDTLPTRTLTRTSIIIEGAVSDLAPPKLAFGRGGPRDDSGFVSFSRKSKDVVLGAMIGFRPFPQATATQIRIGISRRRFHYMPPANPDIFAQRVPDFAPVFRVPVDISLNLVTLGLHIEPSINPEWFGVGLLPTFGVHFLQGVMERGDFQTTKTKVAGLALEAGLIAPLGSGLVAEFGARSIDLGSHAVQNNTETILGDFHARYLQDLKFAELYIRMRLDI